MCVYVYIHTYIYIYIHIVRPELREAPEEGGGAWAPVGPHDHGVLNRVGPPIGQARRGCIGGVQSAGPTGGGVRA